MSVALGLKIDSGYQRAAYLRTVETLLIESRQEHATENQSSRHANIISCWCLFIV